MVKSVICIVTAVFFIVINTIILFLKPNFTFARNDFVNYCVYYQKWIRSIVFMGTLVISLISIYFSLNFKWFLGFSFLGIECLLVIIYALVKYKGLTINEENIKVQRLFRKDINTKFDNISKIIFIPNAKISVKLKSKDSFDVSVNSENFHRFYLSLINHDLKFKTGRIPSSEDHVYLTRYNITIHFPKTMYREYYQDQYFFRNSNYLFSGRSVENHEYIEGYYKESGKDLNEFIDLVKNDLKINGFKYVKEEPWLIDGYDFTVIKSIRKNKKECGRLAYILHDNDEYFVIYADYLLANEDSFTTKMSNAIKKASYEDGNNRFVRV